MEGWMDSTTTASSSEAPSFGNAPTTLTIQSGNLHPPTYLQVATTCAHVYVLVGIFSPEFEPLSYLPFAQS
jgi:hypothetical protein